MNDEATFPQRFSDAVADVVEELRWEARIGSVRELARLSGMTHTSLNKRLGKATPITVRDLAALAVPLKVEPGEIIRRAKERAIAEPAPTLPTLAQERERRRGPSSVQKRAARKKPGEK